VAPTLIAMAIVSFNSSSVAPNSLATARLYFVHGSHPAVKEAPRAIRCFVLRSNGPSAKVAPKNPWYFLNVSPISLLHPFDIRDHFFARNNAPFVLRELLKPVSPTNSSSSKPACFNNARKPFPGIVPPSHMNQLSTRALVSSGSSPVRI